MISSKDRSNQRQNASIDFTNDRFSGQSQQRPQQQQSIGFFAQLSQSLFGSSSQSNTNNQNSNNSSQSLHKSQSTNDNAIQSNQFGQIQSQMTLPPGKSHIQIFLDLGCKNYTRVVIQEETTASEIIKNLKQKYQGGGGSQPQGSSSNNISGLMNTSNIIKNGSGSTTSKSYHVSGGSSTNLNTSQTFSGHQLQSQLSSSSLNTSQQDLFRKTAPLGSSQSSHISKSQRLDAFKDEYGLFMINTRAQNPLLFVRRLMPHDQVQRIYQRAIDLFKRDGEERFKIVFQRNGDIEQFIRSKGGAYSNQFDEENHVVSQLGKSIINNKTYERKGKLYKKSLNSDKFKERQFVLDKDQLFYYKNEKQKDKNFNLIMLSNATICTVSIPKQKYCFEIENDNRKYILSTKSQYDLDQWVYAIQGQIRLSRDNKNIADVNQTIFQKEKDLASHDMQMIQKIFKPKNVIFNPTQPLLLDFINDPFINELLPNLTKYVTLVQEKDYQRHALDKAKDIVQQLKVLQKKLQKSQISEQSHSQDEFQQQDKQLQQMRLSKHQSVQPPHHKNEDYKRYKDLKPAQKIQQLFSPEDFIQIEQEYEKIISDSLDASKQLTMNPRLFNTILLKINSIIKYNYLEDFYKERKVELLSIPTINFKMNMPKMEFNAIGQQQQKYNISGNNQNKNINIFENILIKKAQSLQQQSSNNRQVHTQLDPAFQNQLKIFLVNLSQEQRQGSQQQVANGDGNISDRSNQNNISGISKVVGNGFK